MRELLQHDPIASPKGSFAENADVAESWAQTECRKISGSRVQWPQSKQYLSEWNHNQHLHLPRVGQVRILIDSRRPPVCQLQLEEILHKPCLPQTLQTGVDNWTPVQPWLTVAAGGVAVAGHRLQQLNPCLQHTEDGWREQSLPAATHQLLGGREETGVHQAANEWQMRELGLKGGAQAELVEQLGASALVPLD